MISINISTSLVNELLKNVGIKAEVDRFTAEIDISSNKVSATRLSVLGRTEGEIINGLFSLTNNLDEYRSGYENDPSVIFVTPDVPGFSAVLTKSVSNSTDLNKITGSSAGNGSLNEIVLSNRPQSIKSVFNLKLGSTPSYENVISGILPEELSQVGPTSYNSIDVNGDISAVVSEVNDSILELGRRIDDAVPQLGTGILDNVSLQIDNYIEREIRKLVKSDVPASVVSNAVRDLSISKDPNKSISRLTPWISPKVDLGTFEESIVNIPRTPSTQIKEYSTSTEFFGNKTGSIKEVNPSSSKLWRGKNTNLNIYNFTEVSSVEELIAEFRGMTREVTECVAHWTATFNNQGHIGAREVHNMVINRSDYSFEGIPYHYIIKRNGVIERGRPVNIEGAHALGHNKYSIGISFVAGYNCNSGTPNYQRYVSAESITDSQMSSFNNWLKGFFAVWPGGQAFGHNDISPGRRPDPGFSVPDYVSAKFGKNNVIAANQGPLSTAQLNIIS